MSFMDCAIMFGVFLCLHMYLVIVFETTDKIFLMKCPCRITADKTHDCTPAQYTAAVRLDRQDEHAAD